MTLYDYIVIIVIIFNNNVFFYTKPMLIAMLLTEKLYFLQGSVLLAQKILIVNLLRQFS